LDKIKSVKESSEYKEKEVTRKKILQDERDRAEKILQEELRIKREKAAQDEQNRRQNIIDDTNTIINKSLQNTTKHTFTNLTLSDWDKRHEKQFITYNNQRGWSHYSVDTNNKEMLQCYTGMPSSFTDYYEEGKVPFFTKCPTCKSPTKFNYLNKQHNSGWGNTDSQRSCSFKEVYCDNHYFYDSSTNKHYLANHSGHHIHLNHPKEGAWSVVCWSPSKSLWKEWDPSDPDGSKAMAEKKKKEADDIQRQIAELQAKLSGLR
jgi:hypothetical protein